MKASIQLVDNHLQLPLLRHEETPKLPDYRKAVKVRSMHLKRRLTEDDDLRQRYVEVMESYVRDGYVEKIPSHESSSSNLSWFLPHFSVVNPKKPEKLRIIFDCDTEFQGTPLNQPLVQGPDLTNLLTGVLTRFREKKVALVSDIKSIFHQVKVDLQDKNAFKFFWWSKWGFYQSKPGLSHDRSPVRCEVVAYLCCFRPKVCFRNAE